MYLTKVNIDWMSEGLPVENIEFILKKYCYFHFTDWYLIVKLESQKVMAFVNTKTRRQP